MRYPRMFDRIAKVDRRKVRGYFITDTVPGSLDRRRGKGWLGIEAERKAIAESRRLIERFSQLKVTVAVMSGAEEWEWARKYG